MLAPTVGDEMFPLKCDLPQLFCFFLSAIATNVSAALVRFWRH